jgi:hypothetical protein
MTQYDLKNTFSFSELLTMEAVQEDSPTPLSWENLQRSKIVNSTMCRWQDSNRRGQHCQWCSLLPKRETFDDFP